MEWREVKALLLEEGCVRVKRQPEGKFISRSTAGPSARGGGSVFFSKNGRRVRLALDPGSQLDLFHTA
ncbi:MAG TPA: radical SAM protein, partial [Methanomicrobiales archaeon]|nr:radical SAM protein [Methanomicrobiales archaeon]